jgi:hypothetical protein
MANPFLGEAKHKKSGVVLAMERGGWRCSMPVGMDEERRRGPLRGR